MRRLILAAFGVLAVAGIASAQQPFPTQPPVQYQQPAAYAPTHQPSVAVPIAPASGVNIIKGNGGCTNCPITTANVRGAFQMVGGSHDCKLGAPCNNGCGGVKSDFAFHFGTCKDFFNPCGPKCPTLPFAKPFGTGFSCPRPYDSYSNH